MQFGKSHVPKQFRSKAPMQLTNTFANAASLRSSEWASYFESVYGIDTMRFPFSLAELVFFYSEFLPKSVASSIKLRKQKSSLAPIGGPLVFGDLYYLYGGDVPLRPNGDRDWKRMDTYRCIYPVGSEGGGVRAVHGNPGLESGLPSRSKVEVTHRSDRKYFKWAANSFKKNSAKITNQDAGMWFYLAPGSGIFLDLGRTIVFEDHDKASRKFGCKRGCKSACLAECFTKRAAAQGYDTVQFTARHESLLKYEIMDTRVQKQKGGCPATDNPRFTSGWDGTRPCHCDPSSLKLNCGFFVEL